MEDQTSTNIKLATQHFQRRIVGVDIPEGSRCTHHERVDATKLCSRCRKAICDVCAFAFPHHKHLCPDCASKPVDTMPGDRRTKIIGAFVLALLGSIAAVLLFGALFSGSLNEVLFGFGLYFGFFLPSLIGFSLAYGALDKRRGNPVTIWLAVVWNLLGVVSFVLLHFYGLYIAITQPSY